MSNKYFLSVALGLMALLPPSCAPALAQDALSASGYYTGDKVQISGWENDLVSRHRGLEKFHWSPINTVQHYRVVAAGSQKNSAVLGRSAGSATQHSGAAAQYQLGNQAGQYHYSKPTVISTWADTKTLVANHVPGSNGQAADAYDTGSEYGRNNPQLQVPAAGAGCNTGSAYNNGAATYQTAQYETVKTYGPRLAGRVMHY